MVPTMTTARNQAPRRSVSPVGSLNLWDGVHGAACPAGMQRELWCPGDYDFDPSEVLYKGEFSRVVKAKCLVSGTVVVLKMYTKKNLHPVCLRQIEREISIHLRLDHPNIVGLFGAFEDQQYFYLALEYANGGDLFEEIHNRGGNLSEKDTVNIVALPLLRALAYLHGQGFIHRDIKPENILFDAGMTLKLADFGFVVNQNEERPVTRAGTTQYMAPEIIHNPLKTMPFDNKDRLELVYGEKVDVWSAAVTVYEALHGFPAFGRNDSDRIVSRILSAEPQFFPDIIQLSDEAKDFLKDCFQKGPEGRGSAVFLIQHTWIQQHTARRARRVTTHPVMPAIVSPVVDQQEKTGFALPRRHTRTGPPTPLGSGRSLLEIINNDVEDSNGSVGLDDDGLNEGVAVTVEWNSQSAGLKGASPSSNAYRKSFDVSKSLAVGGPCSPLGLSRRRTEVPRLGEGMGLSPNSSRGEYGAFDSEGAISPLSARVSDAKAARSSMRLSSRTVHEHQKTDDLGFSSKGYRNVRQVPDTDNLSKDCCQPGKCSTSEAPQGRSLYEKLNQRRKGCLNRSSDGPSCVEARVKPPEALLTTSMPCLPRDRVDKLALSPRPLHQSRRNLKVHVPTSEDEAEEPYSTSPVSKQHLQLCVSSASLSRESPTRKSVLTRSSLENTSVPSFSLPQVRG